MYQLLLFLNLFIVYLFRKRDCKRKVSNRGRLVTSFYFTRYFLFYSKYIHEAFLGFCYHFVTFFWFCYNLWFNCSGDLLWKKIFLAIILRQGLLSEWARLLEMLVNGCDIRVNEWTLFSFLKLFAIYSFWSMMKILLVNHNRVLFVQTIW